MIFFESVHRLTEALTAMATAFGPDRPAALCRELTKTYEEVRRGPLADLVAWAAGGVRGEVTVVVGGAGTAPAAGAAGPPDAAALAARVAEAVDGGLTRKVAIADVARTAGLPKRVVYDAVVAARAGRRGTGTTPG